MSKRRRGQNKPSNVVRSKRRKLPANPSPPSPDSVPATHLNNKNNSTTANIVPSHQPSSPPPSPIPITPQSRSGSAPPSPVTMPSPPRSSPPRSPTPCQQQNAHENTKQDVASDKPLPTLPSTATATETTATETDSNPTLAPNEPSSPMHIDKHAIIIFQCASCSSLLSDSSMGCNVDDDYSIVSIPAVTPNVKICEKLDFSTEGHDKECMFHFTQCANCKSIVGKVYTSTNSKTDHLREKFILETKYLITHRCGKLFTTNGNEMETKESPPQSNKASSQPSSSQQQQQQQQQQNEQAAKSERMDVAVTGNGQGPSMALFQDLEIHVDTLTNALNNLTGATKQSRSEMHEMRKSLDEVIVKVVDGESALGHVHNLMLVWDDRLKELNSVKETLHRIIPIVHNLEQHLAFEDQYHVGSQPVAGPQQPVPRITAQQSSSPSIGN